VNIKHVFSNHHPAFKQKLPPQKKHIFSILPALAGGSSSTSPPKRSSSLGLPYQSPGASNGHQVLRSYCQTEEKTVEKLVEFEGTGKGRTFFCFQVVVEATQFEKYSSPIGSFPSNKHLETTT